MSVRESGKLPIVLGWVTGQDGWGGDMNRNLALLSTLTQMTIEALSVSEPPGSAREWDVYFVSENPIGAWVGNANTIAVLIDDAWEFVVPYYGWEARVRSTERFVWWDGEQWLDRETGEPATGGDPAGLPVGQKVLYSRPGSPGPGEKFIVPIDEPLLLAESAAGSVALCDEPATVYAAYRIFRNTTVVGYIVFDGGFYNGVFDVPSSTVFGVGDRLVIQAPDEPAPGLSGVAFSLRLLFTGA